VATVLYTSFTSPLPAERWEELFARLPGTMQVVNHRYKRWQDRHTHLFGRLLLLQGLRLLGDSCQLSSIQYTGHGKPYFDTGPRFNISHSGNCVICVISENMEVGIDTENIRELEYDHFFKLFSAEEWQLISDSSNPLHTFYKFWTIKESVIKAEGSGLSIPLKKIRIKNDRLAVHKDKEWNIINLGIFKDNCTSLASAGILEQGELDVVGCSF